MSSKLKVMSTSKGRKMRAKRADDERGQQNEGKETARVETPGHLKKNMREDPVAPKSSGTKQTKCVERTRAVEAEPVHEHPRRV